MSSTEGVRMRAIMVVGMHRSGTSALTRVLNLLGVDLGDRLLPAGKGNRLGHWEHLDVVEIHESLLRQFDMTWNDTSALPAEWLSSQAAQDAASKLKHVIERDFAQSSLWAVKDPRLCRFLPLWQVVLDDLGIDVCALLAVRNPMAVAQSLSTRDGIDSRLARLSWMEHVAEAEHASRSWNRSVIVYDELLADWRRVMMRVAERLDIQWPRHDEAVVRAINAFLDPHERHNHVVETLSGATMDPVDHLYRHLIECGHNDTVRAEVSQIVDNYQRWAPLFLDDIGLRKANIHELDNYLQEARAEVAHQMDTITQQERKLFGLLETIHGKDQQLQARDGIIAEKDRQLQARDEVVTEKDRQLRAWSGSMVEKDRQLQARDDVIAGKDRQLQARDEIVAEKDRQLRNRDSAIAQKDTVICRKEELVEDRDESMEKLIERCMESIRESEALRAELELVRCSTSWRITVPLRVASRSMKLAGRALKAASHVLCHPLHYFGLARRLGVTGTTTIAFSFLRRGGPKPDHADALNAATIFDLTTLKDCPVGILTTKHCLYVARLIADALARMGIASEVTTECPPDGYPDGVPYFVICPQMFDKLPGLYVGFQMEQSVSSRWFTPEYLRLLENSYAIFDYSVANIKKLTGMGLSPRQFFYMPLGPLADYADTYGIKSSDYEYDVVFYGDVNNERRQFFLSALQKVCKVKVVGDLFGEALYAELAKAKVVVNIHYYEGALLETTRLWECISLGKLVVSEESSDMDAHDELHEFVDFVSLGDVDAMVRRVKHWLSANDERESKLRANQDALSCTPNRFDYFFYRFLLYTGSIDFDAFWEAVGESLPAPDEKLCLNLPEYVERAEAFDKHNKYGFTRFSGLKHPLGWVGCALSYKFMAKWAKKHELPQLIVCEDDVEFPNDFGVKWETIAAHIESRRGNWDLFSGILADLHEGTKVLDCYDADSNTYVLIDRMISTVYNVYDQKALSLLANWNDRDFDVERNTIDRYLERSGGLRVLTTIPFLVGHKEELYSTLWGIQNTEYNELIEGSQKLLQNKVTEWNGLRESAS